MEFIIPAILGLLGAVAATYIWESKLRDHITVKRIIDPTDDDISPLIELYVELFPEERSNYSSDDIIAMIEQQSHAPTAKHVKAEDFLLAAKHKQNVVGFLFCHYYPGHRKAIVSYYGIDKHVMEARRSAARELLKRIHKLLRSHGRQCEYLFFDVERPGAAVQNDENVKRRARINVFKQSARAFGVKAYSLAFDYTSPRISMAAGTEEAALTLMLIPMDKSLDGALPRALVAEFLRFIYLDCYGDIYELDDPRHLSYRAHLEQSLRDIQGRLPETIGLS